MTPDSRSLDLGRLLESTGWVRALAKSLVCDPNTADDLLQDAYVAALSGQARVQVDAGGWLGGVVRNLARREARTAARRRRREGEVARSEALPPADDLLEQAELQKRVIGAVTELDEPYRSMVLLRFFEGLSVEEIARRHGVPSSTGRTRLQRALEKLRERFDREHGGDRAAWCALLVKLAPDHGALTTIGGTTVAGTGGVGFLQGVLAMNGTIKGLTVVALVAIGLVGFWRWSGGPEAAQPRDGRAAVPEVVAQVEAPVAPAELAAQPQVAEEERREVAVESETEAAPELEPEAEPLGGVGRVRARILDREGRSVLGARLTLERNAQDAVSARSEADGEVAVELPLDGESSPFTALVTFPGLTTRFVESRVARGETTHLGEIVLGPAGTLAGVVRDSDGNSIAGARVFVSDVGTTRDDAQELRRHGPVLREPVPETEADDAGRFELGGVGTGFVRLWANAPRHAYASLGPLEVTEEERLDDLVLVLDELFEQDKIEGLVLSPWGEPLSEVRVMYHYRYANSQTSSSLGVERDGRFSLTLAHRVPYDLRAEDREGRWADIIAMNVQPGTLDVVMRFREATWIEVTAVDERGDPVLEFGLQANDAEHQGVFSHGAVENVDVAEQEGGVARLLEPTIVYEVVVDAPGYERATLGPFKPGEAPERLQASLVALPGVHGRILAGGQPVAGATVELCDLVADQTLYLKNGFRCRYNRPWEGGTTSGDDGSFHLFPRTSDLYLLRIEKDGYAVSELELRVEVEQSMKGIEVELGRGGTIEGRVLVPPGKDVTGVVVGLNHGDGLAQTFRVGPEGTYRFERLATGGWQVRARDEELRPHLSSSRMSPNPSPAPMAWNCQVYEGETTIFDLDLRQEQGVHLKGHLDLGAVSARGWTVSLQGSGELAMQRSSASAVLDAEGSFALQATKAGRYRLQIRAPKDRPHGLVIAATLDLAPGETRWEETLALGSIAGEGAPVDADAVLEYRWKGALSDSAGDDVELRVRLEPDGVGTFTIPYVPAGPGEVVRYELEGGNRGEWKQVLGFDVPAGKQKRVYLP